MKGLIRLSSETMQFHSKTGSVKFGAGET